MTSAEDDKLKASDPFDLKNLILSDEYIEAWRARQREATASRPAVLFVKQQRKPRSQAWRAYYDAYLLTDTWRAKRAHVLRRDNGLCQGCLKRPATQVHHLSYAHVGNELLFELASICAECHERAHGGRR